MANVEAVMLQLWAVDQVPQLYFYGLDMATVVPAPPEPQLGGRLGWWNSFFNPCFKTSCYLVKTLM